MDLLDLDYETFSVVNLKQCGVDVYSRDRSTRALMCSYALNDEPVHLWDSYKQPMPRRLREMIESPDVRKIAHNAAFEIAISRNTLGLRTEPKDWYCTSVMALSLGLPADLETLVRDALRLPREFWKDERGAKLMRLFSFPSSTATPETHPQEWADYCGYCVQDTKAEKKVFEVLRRYVPDLGKLFDQWTLGQKINARGLPVDLDFIAAAQALADQSKAVYKQRLKEHTGLDNPNSTKQALGWLMERGYPFASIAKNRAMIAVKDFGDKITKDAKEFILMRRESNKSSLAKYAAIKRASHGGRLRDTFQFRGAGATGRYAGRILGQNMPRPHKAIEEHYHLAEIRQLILEGDLDMLELYFHMPLEALSSSIRSAIAPVNGKKLIVADLASIELCVIAWFCNCAFWQDVVASGKDAYKAFAEKWLGVPYDEVTKSQRFLSKPPALGCGYRMGPGREVGVYPDTEKTGLWGYGANMGVDLTKDQCKSAVKIYRELSWEIADMWKVLEGAAMHTMETGEPMRAGPVVFDRKGPFLRMRLPSGRFIHYCRPRVEMVTIEYENADGEIETSTKLSITYERLSQQGKKWVRRSNHGGRFIEQAVQGIALDLLQHGIENAEAIGFEVVGHYHDEVVTEVDEDSPLALRDLIAAMTTIPKWAEGMHVRAAGYEGKFYRKD